MLRPLNDTIIIEPDENELIDSSPEVQRIVREGLIQLPDNNPFEKSAMTGRIISWGDKCRYKEHYKPGTRLMFKRFGGAKFEYEGKAYKSLVESEALAICD